MKTSAWLNNIVCRRILPQYIHRTTSSVGPYCRNIHRTHKNVLSRCRSFIAIIAGAPYRRKTFGRRLLRQYSISRFRVQHYQSRLMLPVYRRKYVFRVRLDRFRLDSGNLTSAPRKYFDALDDRIEMQSFARCRRYRRCRIEKGQFPENDIKENLYLIQYVAIRCLTLMEVLVWPHWPVTFVCQPSNLQLLTFSFIYTRITIYYN